MTTKAKTTPEEPQEDVEEVQRAFATPGRIVLINVAIHGAEPIFRPAIVVEEEDEDGIIECHPFFSTEDTPLPAGIKRRQLDSSTWNVISRFGPECGNWMWPEIPTPAEPEEPEDL
jgi:hypothetical protein